MCKHISLWIAGLAACLVTAGSLFAQCSPYYRVVTQPGAGKNGEVAVRVVPVGTPAEEIRYGAQSPAKGEPSYYSQDYSGPAQDAPAANKARIRVRLPATAELWVDGKKMSQTGSIREFTTPELNPDRVYTYFVKSRWVDEDGITVEKSLRVRTFSGTRVTVNFVRTRPTFVGTAPQIPVAPPPPPPPPARWTAPVP